MERCLFRLDFPVWELALFQDGDDLRVIKEIDRLVEMLKNENSPKQDAVSENEVVYSSRPFAWFANYNRELLCWRTWQLCFLEDWTEYLGRWPRSGSMRNGIVYRLPPLVPRISGIDYLSSVSDKEIHRTPNASNGIDGGSNSRKAAKKREERFITPTADDTGHRKNKYSQGGQALSHQLGGTLNPQWVEWLMGFPIGWTDCEDSETQ